MNFFRGWEAYRDGFGKLTGEHWLGAWGWQCPLLGGLAQPGARRGGQGFPWQREGHRDPLGQRSRPGQEGSGWLRGEGERWGCLPVS